jgi:DNA-binding transcriptional LysR family regulator
MYDVDTALLRTFVVLAETKSFSRTGQRVGRSQSAVSSQIKRLEDNFGTLLIERDTRNVGLTADGEKLLPYALEMVRMADAMLGRFREDDIEGSVRFGSPEDFATAFLPGILGPFAAAHPRVLLHVTCELTLHLIEAFERGEQDLVIVKQDPRVRHPGARPLWREDLVWVGPEQAAHRGAASLGEARAGKPLPLVVSPAPCVYRARAIAALETTGTPWAVAFQSPSHAGCAAAVRAGLGYAVMPRGLVPEGLPVLTSGQGWPGLSDAELCLLAATRLAPAGKALADFIEARASEARADVLAGDRGV